MLNTTAPWSEKSVNVNDNPSQLTSVYDFFHHVRVALSFLQLCCSDPDLSVCRDVLTGFVQHFSSILVSF